MGNCFTNQKKGSHNDPPSLNEGPTTAEDQGIAPECKQSEHCQREEIQQESSICGFGKFKVDIANMLALHHVLMLATLFLANNTVDRIQQSKHPGLQLMSELEIHGVISQEDVSWLVDALNQCNLGGIASKVEHSYQSNVSYHRGSQPLTFNGKKDLFIRLLKVKYKILYYAVQPLPYVKDKMCCVDKVFIQGNIQRRFSNKRGVETWRSVESYHDILVTSINEFTRCIILGDPGCGKSTLSLQFLYDWCNQVRKSPLTDVDIVIFLRMRQLSGLKSMYQAIKQLLLPSDCSLTVNDIKTILQNTKSTLIFFDGYDEYRDKGNTGTDFTEILKMKKLVETRVIVTTRSANVSETPHELKTQSAQFKLAGFTQLDQEKYILKAVVCGDRQTAELVKNKLNESPFLNDISQIPLFFTIAAHVTHDKENIIPNMKSVTWFFRFMLECLFKHTANKEDISDVTSATARVQLSRIAFNGLSKKDQQHTWTKQKVVGEVGENDYGTLIRTGILTEDDDICITERDDMTASFQRLTTTSFYHQLFCESYAAFHLVDLILVIMGNVSEKSCANVAAKSIRKEVTDLLSSLDHKDLQYLFRFACGLDDKVGCVIIDYLVNQTCDMNLTILCIFEFTGNDEDIADTVRELCSRYLLIERDDSRILQRAKVRLLQIASRCNIPISNLDLWSFSNVDDGDIVLQSALRLPSLSSLEKISINADRQDISENQVIGLLNYGLQSQRFRELWFYECKLPETIECNVIPESSITRNIKVIRPDHASQFDLQCGKWTKVGRVS